MEAERQEVEDVVEAEKREVEDVMEEETQEVEDEVELVDMLHPLMMHYHRG